MYIPQMMTITTLQRNYSRVVKALPTGPVFLSQHSKPIAVMLSPAEYQRLATADEEIKRNMRIHRSRQLTRLWHNLPAEVRRFVNSLLVNQRPEGSQPDPDWPNRFHALVEGYWITWQVVKDRGETIILVRHEAEE